MAPTDQTSIERLDPSASSDPVLLEELCVLINDVYAVAEEGMWVDGTTRTNPDELGRFVAAGEILVARTDERAVVGSVRLHDVGVDTSEFGMLVADRRQRSVGIGRALVEEVERRSRGRGRRAMQLELLVPRHWHHPSKEFLTAWYGRLGYRLARTTTLDEAYPHLVAFLATPCDLQVHRKAL